MKFLFSAIIFLSSMSFVMSQALDSSIIVLDSGKEFKCLIVSVSSSGVQIKRDDSRKAFIASNVIQSIDGLSFELFKDSFLQRNSQIVKIQSRSFESQLEKGGVLVAAGAGITLAAVGLSSLAGLGTETNNILLFTSAGLAFGGVIMTISGGISIAKAGRTYKEHAIGYDKKTSIQYGLLPTGAGIRLRW